MHPSLLPTSCLLLIPRLELLEDPGTLRSVLNPRPGGQLCPHPTHVHAGAHCDLQALAPGQPHQSGASPKPLPGGHGELPRLPGVQRDNSMDLSPLGSHPGSAALKTKCRGLRLVVSADLVLLQGRQGREQLGQSLPPGACLHCHQAWGESCGLCI
jgi:hypothetical protein